MIFNEYIQFLEYIIGSKIMKSKAMYHMFDMTTVPMVESLPCSFLGPYYGTWTAYWQTPASCISKHGSVC
jgi:hypothetical protein